MAALFLADGYAGIGARNFERWARSFCAKTDVSAFGKNRDAQAILNRTGFSFLSRACCDYDAYIHLRTKGVPAMRTAVIVIALITVSAGVGAGAYLVKTNIKVAVEQAPSVIEQREDEAARRARITREVHEQLGDPGKHYHNAFKD